jgi:hypothetical protein
MKSQSHLLLVRRHLHAVWLRPLGIAALGLLLVLLLARSGASARAQIVTLGIVVTLALVSRIWPRRTLQETACALDARVGAHNRFEAVAELGGRTDPLAIALRSEADNYLAAHPLPRANAWFTIVALFAVFLVTNIALLGPGWARAIGASTALVATSQASANPESPSPNPPLVPPATLRWVTPAEEIGAAPKEEVPLVAEAESTTGLRQLLLHVARNGQPLPPVHVAEAIAAGTQSVSSSLRLEELELQPFDVVTYFLRAERIRPASISADPPWPSISSPLQFIQIQSSREERLSDVFSECAGGCVLEIIRKLKREQLGVLRDTVALAHDTVPRTDPSWAELVRTVEERQVAIQKETAELISTLADAGISGAATEALTQAENEAGHAAVELAHPNPEAAIGPAGRALARFAAAEKAVARNVVVNRRRTTTQTEASDLPARENTPAGRLEKMAAQQGIIADQLASRTPPVETPTEQDRLAREITKLAGERALPAEINDFVKSAAGAATEASRQLNEQDTVAAAEPATRAAQALGEAVATLLSMASMRATDELLAAQRALIRTATDLQIAPPAATAEAAKAAAQRVAMIQQDARAAARYQQQQGSADAAQRFVALAKAITQSGVQKDLANLEQSQTQAADPKIQQQREAIVRKLTHLAQGAADSAAGFEERTKTQARAIDELGRARLNLDRAAHLESGRASKNAGLDASVVIELYEKAVASAQRLANLENRERSMPPPPGPGTTVKQLQDYATMLSQRISGLIRVATATPTETARAPVLTLGNPREAPPAYRPAVADYFEALARDSATRLPPKR